MDICREVMRNVTCSTYVILNEKVKDFKNFDEDIFGSTSFSGLVCLCMMKSVTCLCVHVMQ